MIDPSISQTDEELFELFKDVLLPRDISNPDTVTLFKKLYDAHVCEVDENAGNLMDILTKHSVLDDTTVIITSDHGDEFGEHGSLSHDGKFFTELTNVPLMVYNHESANGQTTDKLVSGLDVSPTVVDLFGLDPVDAFQGRSVMPADGLADQPIFGEAIGKLSHKIKETDKPAYFCSMEDLKVTYREEDDTWALYDLSADPAEQENIIDSSPRADEMKALLQPRIGRDTL